MSKEILNKIVSKLERLDEYLRYLAEVRKVSKNLFISDFHYHGLAERYLQLAIEIILDAGKLVIIYQNLQKPEDNQEVFFILSQHNILSGELADKLSGITGFRNILVHDYEKIDREIVYQKLQNNLENFREFKKELLRFFKKQETN